MKNILTIFLVLFSISIFSQENLIAVFPDSIKQNANAVVKNSITEITISSFKNMTIKKYRVITILNELGLKNMDSYEYFDESTSIKNLNVLIYNAFGSEIKKFKRKDFKENSISEGSIITDNKILYLDYTPTQYPFTMVYESEISTSNTAFIPSWFPLESYFISVLNSSIKINYASDVKFKYKEFNLNSSVVKDEKLGSLTYSIQNIKGLRKEELVPSLQKIVPYVMFGLDKFEIEGVEGNAENWNSFGKWVNDKLLSDTEELSNETLIEVGNLIGGETDNLKKSKIIYEYMQNKTRYVSIQLGIGGWKPMLAKNVDRLGYGDCKALTNYTRALLQVFNVPSFYTLIYGNLDKRDIQSDFVSMQGNHAVLAIPDNNELRWLECTSQIAPFDFQANFTDDRYALLVKPEGGELVRTTQYSENDNSQITKGNYTILSDGSLSGKVNIKSKGTQYDSKYELERKSQKDLEEHYHDYFFTIKDLKWEKLNFVNDKEKIEFTEELKIGGSNYASKSGSNLIFALNTFNQYNKVPARYRTRLTPFEVSRGFFDSDEITITIPDEYAIDAKPENFELNEKFGHYKTEVSVVDNQVIYKRAFTLNKGFYEKADYENFRKFLEQIARNDNAKVVLAKK